MSSSITLNRLLLSQLASQRIVAVLRRLRKTRREVEDFAGGISVQGEEDQGEKDEEGRREPYRSNAAIAAS